MKPSTTLIEDLDQAVLEALKLFQRQKLPSLSLGKYRRPLVVGSVNALTTGRILFEDKDAVFADENNYQRIVGMVKDFDGVVLISASGGKHAPLIAKELRRKGINTILWTHNARAKAKLFVTKTLLFPKKPEPYTYNTSTYLGLILAKTKEDPRKIASFLKSFPIPSTLSRYNAFCLLLPSEYVLLREMLITKFDELFGPKLVGRVFTLEQAKHAKTVVPSETELFIGLGIQNTIFGKHRWDLPRLPQPGYASMMALGYYIIGQIQKQHPPYFKENLEKYTQEISTIFGEKITPIVN